MRNIINWIISILLVPALFLMLPDQVSALSLSDYFSFNYSATFSKTTVVPGELFTLTVTGIVTCKQDLIAPYSSISAVQITGNILALNSNGNTIPLYQGFSLTLNNVPHTIGQTIQKSLTLNLQFPAGIQPGTYSITGNLTQVLVTASVFQEDETSSFSSPLTIGTIDLIQASNLPNNSQPGQPSLTPTPTIYSPPEINLTPTTTSVSPSPDINVSPTSASSKEVTHTNSSDWIKWTVLLIPVSIIIGIAVLLYLQRLK